MIYPCTLKYYALHPFSYFLCSFNLIRFSGDIEPWRPQLVEPTEENCHDAVRWVSTFVPAGNTCTLEALSVRKMLTTQGGGALTPALIWEGGRDMFGL